MACARCHDHKFDPIPQRDYYALAGIFRSTETLYGTTLVIQNNRRTTELLELPAGANPPVIGQRLSPDARADLERQLESMQARQREIARGGRQATQGNAEYLRRQAQIHLLEARLANFGADGKPRPLAMAVRDRRRRPTARSTPAASRTRPARSSRAACRRCWRPATGRCGRPGRAGWSWPSSSGPTGTR